MAQAWVLHAVVLFFYPGDKFKGSGKAKIENDSNWSGVFSYTISYIQRSSNYLSIYTCDPDANNDGDGDDDFSVE